MRQKCRFLKVISSFMDCELSENEMNRFRLHLPSCPDCRVQLSRFQRATELLHDLPGITPSDDFDIRFKEKLSATGTAAAPGKTNFKSHLPWAGIVRKSAAVLFSSWRPYMIGATAAGILAAFILVKTNGTPTPDDLLLAQNLEILQEYEILSDLDLLEYWDLLQNGDSES